MPPKHGLAAIALLAAAAGCGDVTTGPPASVAATALTATGSVDFIQQFSTWYRVCGLPGETNASVVLAWSANAKYRVEFNRASVSRAPGGNVTIRVPVPTLVSVEPPAVLLDTMGSPITNRAEQEASYVAKQLGDVSAVARHVAAPSLRLEALRGEVLAIAKGIVGSALRVTRSGLLADHSQDVQLTVDFTPVESEQVSLPEVALCSGTALIVDGRARLRSVQHSVVSAGNGYRAANLGRSMIPGGTAQAADREVAPNSSSPPSGSAFLAFEAARAEQNPSAKGAKYTAKMIGAVPVTAGTYPWVAAMAREAPDGTYDQYCGGSLIAPNLVVTAAHCPVRPGHVAIIGTVDLNNLKAPGVEIIPIESVHEHRAFGAVAAYDSDLAVAMLSTASKKTAIAVDGDTHIAAGDNLTVMGWGDTESGLPSPTLLHAPLRANLLDACKVAYSQEATTNPHLWGITNNMICAGGPNQNACTGDSGGPAVLHGSVVALVSFGSECTKDNTPPTLFTSLQAFKPCFIPTVDMSCFK